MSGDYSRDSFDALRDYAGVFLQQGRAVLDTDWNELVALFERRIRAGTVDTIGRAVVPRETMTGFQIRATGDGGLEIGRGRKYLDGLLLECHGAANFSGDQDELAAPVFDRARQGDNGAEGVLDEMISGPEGDFLDYEAQPYWPTPELLPGENAAHLAYAVAWKREVTPIKDPDLLEPALGGIDTTTRWQTVWQVRVLPDVGDNANCATPDEDLNGWIDEIAPSTARLTTATIDIEDPEDPCLVPPTDGYTGIENQFYRVELHLVGDDQENARFKFSRENASVTAAVESIANPATGVTVSRIGRDDILRFRAGDWVELTDDHREFNHRSGHMLRVSVVHEETREIEFEEAIDFNPDGADLIPTGIDGDTVSARRTRLIRWDQRGIIRLADDSEWTNLDDDGSDGLIPVPDDGRAIVLESGITVSFATADGPGTFREMDHWRFAARTAGNQIEALRDAPPDGIQRHYCRLAIVRFPESVLDCRVFWPPEFEGGEAESCGCTVCVSAEGHNSGALTIQAAIDQVGAAGGTVCLDAGNYLLDTPVTIANRAAIKVQGQGIGTLLVYRGSGAAIRVDSSLDIQLERFSLFVIPAQEDDVGNIPPAQGIASTNSGLVALRRLAVIVLGNTLDRSDIGLAFDGVQMGAKTEECLVLAPIAVGNRSAVDDDDGPGFLALAEFRALDNILFGSRQAVRFEGIALNIAAAIFDRNLVLGTEDGMRVNWFEVPAGSTSITSSTVIATRHALVIGATDLRLQDCDISGGPQFGDGVRLVANLVPNLGTDAQIIGNNIFDLAGAGIRIDGLHEAILIKRNMIRRCGEAGIATTANAVIRHLAIDNNVIEEIADTTGQPGAGAILVTRTATGQINGNAIRAVGQGGQQGQFYAGIAVQGSGSIAIESNVLSEIGPDQTAARSAAILVRPPYFGITLNANRINGGTDSDAVIGWAAIEIGSIAATGVVGTAATPTNLGSIPGGYVSEVPGIDAADLAYVTVENTLYAMTPAAFRAVAQFRTGQINVMGNQMSNATRLIRPMTTIFDAGAIAVNFSQNQCLLNAGGGLPAVILIGARRITAGSNSVIHQTDAVSMRLITGGNGAATPIGNITTASIDVQPGGLQPPFSALNLNA